MDLAGELLTWAFTTTRHNLVEQSKNDVHSKELL